MKKKIIHLAFYNKLNDINDVNVDFQLFKKFYFVYFNKYFLQNKFCIQSQKYYLILNYKLKHTLISTKLYFTNWTVKTKFIILK